MSDSQDEFSVADFFEHLATRIAAFEEKRKDPAEAFDFTAAAIYRPGETTLSRILAFLLDPHATHNQGDAFLRIFCETILEWDEKEINERLAELERVVVRTEHLTDLLDEGKQFRRIDITIEFGRKFIVGIENKPWAEDQWNQVHDYCKYMERWDDTRTNFLCLYLTPDGKGPTEKSLPDPASWSSQLKLVSWRDDLHNLLDKCAAVCKAAAVTTFINDIRKHLHYVFTGVRDMTMEKEIKEYLTSSDVNQEAVIHAANQIEIVRRNLWEEVKKQMSAAMDAACVADGAHGPKDHVIVRIEKAGWSWELFFYKKECDSLGCEVLFPTHIPDDQLEVLERNLSLSWLSQGPSRVGGDSREYTANWTESAQPWLDMVKKEDGGEHSVFVGNVLRWYKEDAEIVEAFLKHRSK